MAFTSKVQDDGILKSDVAKDKKPSYNITTFVAIRSRVDAKVKVTGAVTGMQYVFERAGAIVNVDSRDKDELLNKKRGRACCGGNPSNTSLFELV